ncbi:MAG: bifunctional riboflavin kinase/FAD synthetase [Bacteroidota bacterium]
MKIHSKNEKLAIHKPVVTVGIFDGVHKGHKFVLNHLRKKATQRKQESVVLTFWPHPRMVLKKAGNDFSLLNTLDEKINLLSDEGIDHLVILTFTNEFSLLTSGEFVKQILIDYLDASLLLMGYNQKFGHNRTGTFENVQQIGKEHGLQVEQIPVLDVNDKKISSSGVRNSILKGDLQTATDFLGYHYNLTGNVTGGSKIGRKIGFPTANIEPEDQYKLVPPDGVYAVEVEVRRNQIFKAMLNIGFRPTINDGRKRTIEAHLFNFDENLYGEKITIYFIKKLRDEKKFTRMDELKNQLEKDKKEVLNILK